MILHSQSPLVQKVITILAKIMFVSMASEYKTLICSACNDASKT